VNRAQRRKMGHTMKINFSRSVPYTPEWNGNRELPEAEQVKAVIKPMTVDDLLVMMDALGRRPGVPEGDPTSMDTGRLIKEAGALLPKYVEINNLTDDSGPVSVNDLLTFGAFIPLASELLMECARVSMPSESAEGNLKRPPG